MSESKAPPAGNRNVLTQAWLGIAPLWKAFWLIGFVGHVLVVLTTDFLLGWVPRSILSQSAMIWSGTMWLVYLFYTVFSSICIWRCARNTRSPIWSDLSIIALTFNALFVASGIFVLLATGGS